MSLRLASLSQTLLQTGPQSKKPTLFVHTIQNKTGAICLQFSQQALKNGVTVTTTLEMVQQARKKGLKAPVLFMGYYNPMLSYGEERLLKDCREAGVNGFIIVDLPPEEAVTFRNWCTMGG
jgi:tryptophan synthase alpha subunit